MTKRPPQTGKRIMLWLSPLNYQSLQDVAIEMHAKIGPTARHLMLIGLRVERERLGLPPSEELQPTRSRSDADAFGVPTTSAMLASIAEGFEHIPATPEAHRAYIAGLSPLQPHPEPSVLVTSEEEARLVSRKLPPLPRFSRDQVQPFGRADDAEHRAAARGLPGPFGTPDGVE